MSFTDALKKLGDNQAQKQQGQQQPARAPMNGPVPGQEITQQEADALRNAKDDDDENDALNKMRVEQLSAAIFARLVGQEATLDVVLSIDAERSVVNINQSMLEGYLQVCNTISSMAAVAHANGVWGVPCAHGPKQGAQAPAEGPPQQGQGTVLGPPSGFVPPQQVPREAPAQ